MKLLVLSLLASLGLTTPLRRDVNHPIYTLRLTSPEPYFNGTYLTTTTLPATATDPSHPASQNNTQLGVYTDARTPQVYFYAVHDPATGYSTLHDAGSDAGSGGHTLALLGANGLLKLASLADPGAVTVPEGGTCDWTSFRLVEGSEGGELQYAESGGRWVAFPNAPAAGVERRRGEKGERAEGGWNVVWKGDEALTTDDYMVVQVVYELVTGA